MRYTALTLIALVTVAAATGAGLQASLSILGGASTGTQTVLDADGDRIPDATEAELCQRGVTSQAIALLEFGKCNGSNWTPPTVSQSALLPTAVVPGADKDGDLLPGFVTVTRDYVIVTPFETPIVRYSPGPSITVSIDMDDNDANKPAASEFRVLRDLPATVTLGPDKDKDSLPAYVTVRMMQIEVDRRLASAGISIKVGTDTQVAVDTDDTDARQPVVDKVKAFAPTMARHNGDGDKDLLPGELVFEWLTVTIDRKVGDVLDDGEMLSRIELGTRTTTIPLDEDDKDRDSVVPLSLVDADADFIADEAEPIICMVQKKNDPTDGECVRADGTGSDGSGNNYVPPMLGTVIDTLYSLDAQGTAYSLSGGAKAQGESAPGAGLALTVGLLAGLVAVARRRL